MEKLSYKLLLVNVESRMFEKACICLRIACEPGLKFRKGKRAGFGRASSLFLTKNYHNGAQSICCNNNNNNNDNNNNNCPTDHYE